MTYFTSELLIESIEIQLLVEEGFGDKVKGILAKVIERIKKFVKKVKNFIKEKLNVQLILLKRKAKLIDRDRQIYKCVSINSAFLRKYDAIYSKLYDQVEDIFNKEHITEDDRDVFMDLIDKAKAMNKSELTEIKEVNASEESNRIIQLADLMDKKHKYLWSIVNTFEKVANDIESKPYDREAAMERIRCQIVCQATGQMINWTVDVIDACLRTVNSLERAQKKG